MFIFFIVCLLLQYGLWIHFNIKLYFCRSSHHKCSMKKGTLINFTKFTGKQQCQSLFFNKIAGLRAATLLKQKLWQRCFLVNFTKCLRTSYLQNTSGRMLLNLFVARILNFSLSKVFTTKRVASCEKSRLVEYRL